MATHAAPLARAGRVPRVHAGGAAAVGVGLLAGLSILLRTRHMDVGLWIDEALSVGIADRPFTDIPGVLRQDGSPPLYYLLLNLWIGVFGRSEEATHALSLVFAIATIPVAFLVVRPLFGTRAAWVAALFFAANPFLTQYGQETRMYALVVLAGTVATGTFLGAFALRRGRRWTWGFAASLAVLLYTHNWTLFFVAACLLTWLVLAWGGGRDRALLREGLLGFGAAALAYLPWLPSLVFQARHTGAPWARRPGVGTLAEVPELLLEVAPGAALLVAAVAGFGALWRGRVPRVERPQARAAGAVLAVALGTVLIAWLASQVSPAWATRYLAIAVAPFLLAAAIAVAHAGLPGLAALVVVLGSWAGASGPPTKSDVREVTEAVLPSLRAGDLVISTQPEQVPALAYYAGDLAPRLRWATLWGPVTDLGVTDWRDGVQRLRATSAERDLAPLLDRVPPGGRVVLVRPRIYSLERWTAPWTRLVRLRGDEWRTHMQRDERFRVITVRPMEPGPVRPNPVEATVFIRDRVR